MGTRIIRESWDAYKKNFWPIVGAQVIYIIVLGLILIVSLLPLLSASVPLVKGGTIPMEAILQLTGPAMAFFLGIFIAVIAAIVLDVGRIGIYLDVLRGREARIDTMFSVGRKKFWTSIGSTLLITIIIISAAMLLILPTAALSSNIPGASVLMLVDAIVLVLFAILFSLNRQAIVVENYRAINSVKRSYSVVKRNYSEFLTLVVIFTVIGLVLMQASGVGRLLILLVLKPVADIAYTLFYLEKTKAHHGIRAQIKPRTRRRAKKKKRKR